MRTLHKFPIPPSDDLVECDIRSCGQIVHVGMQHGGIPCIWVDIPNDTLPDRRRVFRAFGTGHSIPDGWSYVGTAVNDAFSPFVWHIFELCGTVNP